ncbi:MAG: hypothetical protein O7E52_07200 [Candidatus Poribacteria bacterium]|nr:hypothetical protein [Candidatus Poribacteria bacterium]
MRKSALLFYILLISIAFRTSALTYGTEAYYYVPGAVHLDSYVSGSEMGIDELVRVAYENGMQVAIITDHDNEWATYGLWPFRDIIKYTGAKRYEFGPDVGKPIRAIKKYGAQNYIDSIEGAGRRYQVATIHGVEAVPYYQWEGRGIRWGELFKPTTWFDPSNWLDLKLRNWHRHLLVIGLETAEDYEKLPSLGNSTYPLRYDLKGIGTGFVNLLLPALLIVVGIQVFRRPKKRKRVWRKRKRGLAPRAIRRKIIGGCMTLLGLLGLWSAFPFLPRQYDPYRDSGEKPYQSLIDYVNRRDGMVFWAHPESESNKEKELGFIKTRTEPYPNLLRQTTGYTGFAIFQEGMRVIGKPDGIWDELLRAYCRNERERPIWAIGEADFEGGNSGAIRETQTIFLVKKAHFSNPMTADDQFLALRNMILQPMKRGRMYATTRIYAEPDAGVPRLEFYLRNAQGEIHTMGETSRADHRGIHVEIKLSIEKARYEKVTVQIIRSRRNKIQTWQKPIDNVKDASIVFKDESYLPGETIYYRVLVYGGLDTRPSTAIMASNPIFVEYVQ